MNWLDRAILAVAPERGANRLRARAVAGLIQKRIEAYEAAGVGRRFDGFRAGRGSANAELERSLIKLRDRHRTLVRDNPWARRAVQSIVTNTVGHGITGEVFGPDGQVDDARNDRFKEWAESRDIDAAGLHDIYGLQALAMETVATSGEALIRRRRRRPGDGLTLPLQIEVAEPDYLDHSRSGLVSNTGKIVQGVEFDPIGRRRAYWMFREHPGDTMTRSFQSVPVPASEVSHVYRQRRPGQVRGEPWGSAAIITLHDLDGFEDAFLFRQKLANCFAAFTYEEEPGVPGQSQAADVIEQFEPGMIEHLPSGRKVTIAQPPPAGDYGTYVRDCLYRVAAAYGISFQSLTGDLRQVNFSSGRMGKIEMNRNLDVWQWHMLIPMMLDPLAEWFFETDSLLNGAAPPGTHIRWNPPTREMVDPAREVNPMVDAVRSGAFPLSHWHRELGFHTKDVLREIAATNKALDEQQIVLDSDPRKVSRAGLTQARQGDLSLPPTDFKDNEGSDDD